MLRWGDDLKKIVSLYLFYHRSGLQKEGLNEVHFAPNYSSLQAYDLVFNDELSVRLKKKSSTTASHV
ncbi:hypothetical protein GCM10020331_072100 [Ectobacillus funiculus]